MLELEIKAQKAISMQEHWLNEMHAHDLYEEIYHNIKNNQSIIFDITEGIVKVIGISNRAKNGLLIVANLEELNKVAR